MSRKKVNNHKNTEIGKRIKALRKEKKLTQINFGRLIRRDASTVSKIESGELESSGLVRLAICNTFGIRKEWLLTGKGPKYDDRKRLLEKKAKELGDDIWIWFLMMRSAYNKDLKVMEEAVDDIFTGKSVSLEEVVESDDPKFYKLLGQFESIYAEGDAEKIAAIEGMFNALAPAEGK
jgi:transcriptional regulator with XRE-family HTH domain